MTSRRSRRNLRALSVAAMVSAAVLTLSGCLSVTADIAIDSDAITSGTVAIGLQKSTMEMLGVTFDDFSKDITDKLKDPSETSGELDGIDPASCKTSQTASEFVMTCDITPGPDAMGEDFTVTKNGDSIELHMSKKGLGDLAGSDSSDLEDLFGDAGPLSGLGGGDDPTSRLGDLLGGAERFMSGATFTVNVQFPGDITSITGEGVEQTSDTSVSISSALTDSLDVSVTSNATPGSRVDVRTVVLVLLIVAVAVLGLAVVALLVVLVWLLSRRGNATAADVVTQPAVELPRADPEQPQP
jgi:hypothetical protein